MSQVDYIKKVFERLNMNNEKVEHVPLSGHIKFSKTQCPKNEEEKEKISKLAYS